MTAPSTGAVGGAQHRDECPVHQPVDANGKAALRNLYEAFDRVKAEEWRIFVAATGYDPEDPSEDDYGTCVREAVAQVRADERQKVTALLADEHTVEKVAEEVWAESASPGAAPTDAHRAVARAVLDVIAGLIGGEDE